MSRDQTCEERIDAMWESTLDSLNHFMAAAYRQGVFNDRDSDYDDATIEEQDDPEFPWVLSSGDGDEIDCYRTEAEAEEGRRAYRAEKGLDVETGARPDPEEVWEEYRNYASAFDYVAPYTFGKGQDQGYWRYQMSGGGPSDEIRFYGECIREGVCRFFRAEYWFLDWFDGAHRTVTKEKAVSFLWDDFNETGSAYYAYQEGMEGYEEPVDEEDENEDD